MLHFGDFRPFLFVFNAKSDSELGSVAGVDRHTLLFMDSKHRFGRGCVFLDRCVPRFILIADAHVDQPGATSLEQAQTLLNEDDTSLAALHFLPAFLLAIYGAFQWKRANVL